MRFEKGKCVFISSQNGAAATATACAPAPTVPPRRRARRSLVRPHHDDFRPQKWDFKPMEGQARDGGPRARARRARAERQGEPVGIAREARGGGDSIDRFSPSLLIAAPQATSPVIHVIVKPTAWTTTTLTSEQTATPLPALVTPPPVSPPAASTSTPPTAAFTAFTSTPATATPLAANNVVFGKFVAHLAMMAPMQRTTLLLELQKGHFVYTQLVQLRMTLLGWSEDNALSIRSDTISRKTGQKEPYDINEGESEEDWRARMGEEEIEQVVELLKGCDLWALVEERIAVARGDMENWDARNPAGKPGAVKGEFELVQVGFVVSHRYTFSSLNLCASQWTTVSPPNSPPVHSSHPSTASRTLRRDETSVRDHSNPRHPPPTSHHLRSLDAFSRLRSRSRASSHSPRRRRSAPGWRSAYRRSRTRRRTRRRSTSPTSVGRTKKRNGQYHYQRRSNDQHRNSPYLPRAQTGVLALDLWPTRVDEQADRDGRHGVGVYHLGRMDARESGSTSSRSSTRSESWSGSARRRSQHRSSRSSITGRPPTTTQRAG